jgi:C-terminal processing protease CtpA/Prc
MTLHAYFSRAGVGLLLEKSEKGGDVTVKKIIPGGAVDEDGRIKLKDVLLRVDGKAVDNLKLEEVRSDRLPPNPVFLFGFKVKQLTVLSFQILELITGIEGTRVCMDVQRDGSDFKIELVRKKVSQVGVVNTGEQLLASTSKYLFPGPGRGKDTWRYLCIIFRPATWQCSFPCSKVPEQCLPTGTI